MLHKILPLNSLVKILTKRRLDNSFFGDKAFKIYFFESFFFRVSNTLTKLQVFYRSNSIDCILTG